MRSIILGNINNFTIGELLLLLKGRSRSHVTCKALCHSNCSMFYKSSSYNFVNYVVIFTGM